MTATVRSAPVFHADDANGVPLSGGKLSIFAAGTSTAKTVYQDAGALAAHPHPIVLNARGETVIFWDSGAHKVRLEDANGVLIWEVDGYDPASDTPPAPSPTVNLLANGSFSADSNGDGIPDHWQVSPFTGGSAGLDPANGHHGASALRFIAAGGIGNGGGSASSISFVEVTPGAVLDLRFSLISTVASIHNAVDVLWFDAAQSALAPQTVHAESAANPLIWTDYRYKVAAPAGAYFLKIRLTGGLDTGGAAGTTWFDRVMLTDHQPQFLRTDGSGIMEGDLTINGGADALRLAPGADDHAMLSLYPRSATPTVRGGFFGFAVAAGDHIDLANEQLGGHINLTTTGTGVVNANGNRVLTVADEGAGNGIDADTLDGQQAAAFAATVHNHDGVYALAADPIGVSQSWQDVSASRALNSWYQNTTGRPIMVGISIATSTGISVQLKAGPTTATAITIAQDHGVGGGKLGLESIIPPNDWYQVVGGSSLSTWAELR